MPATSSGVGDFPVGAGSKLAVAEDDLKRRPQRECQSSSGTAPGRAGAYDGQRGRAVDVLGLDQQIGTVLRELLRQLVAWRRRVRPRTSHAAIASASPWSAVARGSRRRSTGLRRPRPEHADVQARRRVRVPGLRGQRPPVPARWRLEELALANCSTTVAAHAALWRCCARCRRTRGRRRRWGRHVEVRRSARLPAGCPCAGLSAPDLQERLNGRAVGPQRAAGELERRA
jgi:hypothetical protein